MNAPLHKAATDLFVRVPEVILPGSLVVPPFNVSKYPCSRSTDGKLVIDPSLKPWVRVSYHEAMSACSAAGYQPEHETQRLALGYLIASDGRNWTGGQVGAGKLYQGLRKWRVSEAQPGNYVPSDPDERRYFYLPDGQIIYDVAGNVWQWVFDDVQGDAQGIVARKFAKDSPSLVIPYPAEDKGQGWTPRAGDNWSGDALVRGGCWRSESYAGVFGLSYVWPDYRYGGVGFRCTQPGL